jgi:hypothetical protein
MAWYEEHKDRVFHNRKVLRQYCRDDFSVLRQACRIFRRNFPEIGNVDIFHESLTIASACSKVLRLRFVKP